VFPEYDVDIFTQHINWEICPSLWNRSGYIVFWFLGLCDEWRL